MHVRHVPNIIERQEENCYLLINRNTGQKLVLNEESFAVWKLCEDSPLENVVEEVVRIYSIDEKAAEEQITNLMRSFHKKGFVELEE